MVYANDLWIQLPVRDLYDSLMMLASILAAREMYNQAREDMNKFYDKYGDFMSPIASDIEKYNSTIINPIKEGIQNLYDNGIDPLRSQLGRMMLANIRNSIDTSKVGLWKQRAENAREWYKNMGQMRAKGLYNEAFSRFLGENPDQWNENSAGFTSPTEYMDLNKYTTHIFDALKDSFIRKEGPYDYYGVTEGDLKKALTPDTLGGLLNTNLGKFFLENAKNDLAAQGNYDPTDKLIIDQFRDNVIAANHEKVHEDRKLNELYKLQYEHNSRMQAARTSRASQLTAPQLSIAELIRTTSSTRIVGQQTQEFGKDTLAKQRDAQIKIGEDVSKATNGHSNTYKGRQMYKQAYLDNNYSAAVLTQFVANQGFQLAKDEPNTIIIRKQDFGRLSTLSELVSNTAGFRGARLKRDVSKKLKGADEVRITFTGGNYGAYMKDATNQNHFAGIVKVNKIRRDDAGNPLSYKYGSRKGLYVYDVVKVMDDVYFDSHITSLPDDPRLGYLGPTDKKGRAHIKSNMPITNSQDTKYQDAVMSDVYTTKLYTQGSGYDYDVTYTELPRIN